MYVPYFQLKVNTFGIANDNYTHVTIQRKILKGNVYLDCTAQF